MLERDIVAAIKRYLATLGGDAFFWKEHGGPYGASGVPDIICCYRGRFLGLEVKFSGGSIVVSKFFMIIPQSNDKVNLRYGKNSKHNYKSYETDHIRDRKKQNSYRIEDHHQFICSGFCCIP